MSSSSTMSLLAAVGLLLLGMNAHAQLTDQTQTPNLEGAGIFKSLDQQIGAGVGDLLTPGSSTYIIARDLEQAIALEPDHISLYGLTVEEGTPLGRWVHRGQMTAAPDNRYEDEYLLAHEVLGRAGYHFYEVSNAARPGREAVHNRAYWRLVPYLGIGPSAHSFDGASRWWNEPAYARWFDQIANGQDAVAGHETLTPAQQAVEQVYLGLRTSDGMALDHPAAGRLAKVADQWIRQGWAERTSEGRLRLSTLGWLRLDELAASV